DVSEQVGNGVLDTRPHVVIAETAPDAIGRAETRKGFDNRLLRGGIEGDEVAGEDDQVGLGGVGDLDILADLRGRHVGADVDVRELADTKTLKGAGQTREADGRRGGFEIEASVQKAVRASDEGRPGNHGAGGGEEITARGRGEVGAFRQEPADDGDETTG